MGQLPSSNRILQRTDQTYGQREECAQKKPNTSDHDTNATTEHDSSKAEMVIDTNRRIPKMMAPVRHEDTNKRQQGQLRSLERAPQTRNTSIEEYQRERTGLLDRLQQLERRHELLETAKAEAESALQKMRKKAGLLQSQLQECKNDLFRLQPFNETTDATVLQQYETLNQHILSWVDDLFSPMDDENARREISGMPPHPFVKVEDAGVQGFLASSANASEYWLIRYLHRRLQESVFVEGVCLSYLRDDFADFINLVEQSMGTLKPRRDTATLNAWRSETLAALANHSSLKDTRSEQALKLAQHIHRDISSMMPGASEQKEHLHSLHEKIVTPAMELALNIQLTLGRYYFYPCNCSLPNREHRLTVQHMSEHTMIDMNTRRTLKDDSPVIAADDGTIGEKLFVLEPSLLRRGRGENPDVLMRKAVCLVKLDKPLGKRRKEPVSDQKDVIMLE